MTFPVVESIESALFILKTAIAFGDEFGIEVKNALVSTEEKILRQRNKRKLLGQVNIILQQELEQRVPADKRERIRKHLGKLIDILVPYQKVMFASQQEAKIPNYGQALHLMTQKIHNTLFEWDCFKLWGKNFALENEKALVFLDASQTYAALKNNESAVQPKGLVFEIDKSLYFGIGHANHRLYLHAEDKWALQRGDFQEFYFRGHEIHFQHHIKDDKAYPPRKFAITRADFARIATGLLKDFLYYSNEVRAEVGEIDTLLLPSGQQKPNRIIQLGRLWTQFFKMTEDFFVAAPQSKDAVDTFLGVFLTTILLALSVPLSFLNAEKLLTIQMNLGRFYNSNTIFLTVIFLIGGLMILLPLGFYLVNGLIFLTARALKGKGDFQTQTFNQSLVGVPFAVFVLLAALMGLIPPIVGVDFGYYLERIFSVVASLYALVPALRALKISHRFKYMQAIWAVLLPNFGILFLFGLELIWVMTFLPSLVIEVEKIITYIRGLF
jgi:hypothetical protein